jgi:RimJ/RimL family protein N-acetyltransferase
MDAQRPSPKAPKAGHEKIEEVRSATKILETPRLILRSVTIKDAGFVLDLMNEPAFIRNVADRGLRTRADAKAYITEKALPSYANFGFGSCRVDLKEISSPIGMCGLLKRESLEDVDIGFAFLERYWGNGYAFEAACAVIEYGRTALRIERIVGITAPGNHAAIALLEKLGLKFQRKIDLPGYRAENLLFR